jgi:hypothetical protein
MKFSMTGQDKGDCNTSDCLYKSYFILTYMFDILVLEV